MLTIEEVTNLLDAEKSTISEFKERDPFNSDNEVRGFLCRQSTNLYGTLIICEVNGRETEPQIIYCTPKLHYPFGRSESGRHYNFPKFVKVHVYEKLDGTNICNYSYVDADGYRYSTFKTRLSPFLRKSDTFGDFLGMWYEILKENPHLRAPEEVLDGRISLSYELYGYRNQHLIVYEVPLETQLLFAVRQKDQAVLIPQDKQVPNLGVNLPIYDKCSSGKDLVKIYEDLRESADTKNKKTQDGTITGSEGFIFYVLTEEGRWEQFKCKPESVEQIHWVSDRIPYDVIIPTVWNAFESCDDPTREYIIELLEEEFEKHHILKSVLTIDKALKFVNTRREFQLKVKTAYDNCPVKQEGKAPVMRYLSQSFEKKEMKAVFTALKEMNILLE